MNSQRKSKAILILAAASLLSLTAMAKDNPRWGKASHSCISATQGLVTAKLKGVKIGRKKKTCESKKGYKAPKLNLFGAKGKPSYCKTKPTGVYGYWNIKNDNRCKKVAKVRKPYWAKIKHRCVRLGQGLITANLLGVKDSKGSTLRYCQSANAPKLNVREKLRYPDICKKKFINVQGQWSIKNDSQCKTKLWPKAKPNLKNLKIGK